MIPGGDPIDDEELLYRRIPFSQGWYDPAVDDRPSPEAFRPNSNDVTGLSIYRGKYRPLSRVAEGRPGKQYYVAVFRAGDLRKAGIEIAPRPLPGDPGHAEIPGIRHENRKSDEVLQMKVRLAEKLCRSVEGPFQSAPPPEPECSTG